MEIDPAWLETDFYETLGVRPDAEGSEITRAYRRLARDLHPDTNPDPAAGDRFKELTAAYDVLGDPETRAAYDRARRRAASGRTRPRPGGGYTIRVDHVDDTGPGAGFAGRRGSVFAEERASAGSRARTASSRLRPRRGAAVQAELTLPLTEAVEGTTRTVSVPGHGTTTVRVPGGVEDGQRIRVPGKGWPGTNGGPPGDLVVTVHVDAHPRFGRRGDDLTLTVPITFTEAARGADIAVPTLEGESVRLRLPPGTPSGRVLRVRGRGVPTRGGRGDLLVTVVVHVPGLLTERQRALLDELADLEDPEALRVYLHAYP